MLTFLIIIIIIILALELLPIGDWLNKLGWSWLIPIFFSVILIAIIVLPMFGFAKAFHWYDYAIAFIACTYEWFAFFKKRQNR